MLKRIDVSPAYKIVCETIQNEIMRGELAPGSQLPTETVFAEKFGLTRHTVREGLRILEQTGLVRRGAGRRLFVKPPLNTELAPQLSRALVLQRVSVRELLEMQSALEMNVAEFASERITPTHIKALEKNIEKMKKVAGRGGGVAGEIEHEFHSILAEAANNRALMLIREPIAQLFFPTLSHLLSRPHHKVLAMQRAIVAHEKIVDAIRMGNSELMLLWMKRHMNDFHAGCERCKVDMEEPIHFPAMAAAE